MNQQTIDCLAIRETLENWVVWRDAGDWKRFASVWHPQGKMMATWFQGSGTEFIRVSKEGWAKGVSILHFLGGTSIDLSECGTRAVAQTKMTISQRGEIEGQRCDVVCTGRFYDLLKKEGDQWLVLLRQPIYEKDRVDPLVPGTRIELDQSLLEAFPEGYRHLAYLQTRIGYTVKKDMPGLRGAEVEALYGRGREWLDSGTL